MEFVQGPEFLVTPLLMWPVCLLSQDRFEEPVRPWRLLSYCAGHVPHVLIRSGATAGNPATGYASSYTYFQIFRYHCYCVESNYFRMYTSPNLVNRHCTYPDFNRTQAYHDDVQDCMYTCSLQMMRASLCR